MQQASNSVGLLIGQRLEIGFVVRNELTWLASRLEDRAADGEQLTVAWPTDASRRLMSVNPGQVLHVAASTPQDALYAAETIVQLTSTEPVPLITVHVSGPWQRSQRRNAVRVGVAIRPRIALKLIGPAHKSLRLGVTNLSATGVQVRSQDELRSGDLLDLAFELMGIDDEVQLKARVNRVYRLDRGVPAHAVWDAGCEFEGVPDRLAQRIVQYIFAQQRALARAKRGQL